MYVNVFKDQNVTNHQQPTLFLHGMFEPHFGKLKHTQHIFKHKY